ncbi:Putative YjbQ-like superfamily protein [Septoria linicola]|uniref:YjbQ-like superfamily protein n=1 Tax=Septoria linicola TaxID=215465 RepID=A0A9Q9AS79_9PEZI|nr:Putative YjbQ-like superfamily protein [Septoria linicola]
MPFDTNLRNTCIFLAIFILAFFPNFFQLLLLPLTYPLGIFVGDFSATPVLKLPTCNCCPPASCQTAQALTSPATTTMSWTQKTFTLPSQSRGSYLITDTILKEIPEVKSYKVGLLHLFIQHTSCALSLNENWDEDVRADMSDALDRIAPQDRKGQLYRHSCEGPDDMPAHIKSALVGASVSVPISEGRLATGTWQGIWYLEFRESKMKRKVVATLQGERYEGK